MKWISQGTIKKLASLLIKLGTSDIFLWSLCSRIYWALFSMESMRVLHCWTAPKGPPGGPTAGRWDCPMPRAFCEACGTAPCKGLSREKGAEGRTLDKNAQNQRRFSTTVGPGAGELQGGRGGVYWGGKGSNRGEDGQIGPRKGTGGTRTCRILSPFLGLIRQHRSYAGGAGLIASEAYPEARGQTSSYCKETSSKWEGNPHLDLGQHT